MGFQRRDAIWLAGGLPAEGCHLTCAIDVGNAFEQVVMGTDEGEKATF